MSKTETKAEEKMKTHKLDGKAFIVVQKMQQQIDALHAQHDAIAEKGAALHKEMWEFIARELGYINNDAAPSLSLDTTYEEHGFFMVCEKPKRRRGLAGLLDALGLDVESLPSDMPEEIKASLRSAATKH
jgi:hypothetical protein